MVSSHPRISNSPSPFTKPLVNVISTPITIGITVTFMFHCCCFFSFLATYKYLSLFRFLLFSHCGPPARQSPVFGRSSFFLFFFSFFFLFCVDYHCNIAMIRIREIYGYVKTFTCIGIPRNTDGSLGSGTKHLLPSWLLGFRHEERETHNFYYADCSSSVSSQLTDPTNARAPRSKQLDSSRSKSQLTAFFKIPKNHSPSLPGMTSFPFPVSFPIRGFYYDICDCHILPVWAWTPALNACPYTCTKPKGSKPN